jgi:hypothetical protein
VCITPFGLPVEPGRAVGADCIEVLVQPDVASFLPADVRAGLAHHQHFLQHVRHAGNGAGGVDIGLEGDLPATPQALVGGDDQFGLAVDDPSGQGVGRESAEHHRMDGADACAGEHGEGRLRNHRQVDRYAVPFLHPQFLENVGEAADRLVQFAVGDLAVHGRVVALPDDGHLVGFVFQVAVYTVGADIEGAVVIPANVQVLPVEGNVLDLGEGLDPVDALALFRPEALVVLHRAAIHRLVLVVVDPGLFRQSCGYRISLFHGARTS